MKIKKPEYSTAIWCPVCQEEGRFISIALVEGKGRCPKCGVDFTCFEESKEEELTINTPLTEDNNGTDEM